MRKCFVLLLVTLSLACAAESQEKAARTVRGVVFDDANGNGQRDKGERGLAGIAVSDQSSVVMTGSDGSFQLEAGPSAGVVFVSLPDGWAAAGLFWRPLKEAAGEQNSDFALRRRPTSGEFTFVHASDPHVNDATLPRLQRFREMVEQLHPAFVLLTGDLVKDALRVPEREASGYYEMIVAELARFTVPVWTVPGNHEIFGIERSKSKVSADHPLYGKKMYRHFLGPNYYSFTWGGVRFVGLDSVDITAEVNDDWYYGHIDAAQLAWLKSDLAGVTAGLPVVTFNHIPMATAVEVMSGYTDEPPAPSLIRINGKLQYRHMVSNTADLLAVLRPFRLEIALGGHMHVRESLVYETEGRPIRLHQAGAIVGASEAAGRLARLRSRMKMPSGFTLYRFKDGKIDDGTFISLDK